MSNQQRTVLWIGLILIILNVVSKVGVFKSVIFGTPAKTAAKTGGNTSPSPLTDPPPGIQVA